MKKSILAVVLSAVMLVTCVLPAFADEAAWTWADDGYTVAQYYTPIVETGSIKIDAELDAGYLNATKIESFVDENPYYRSPDDTYAPVKDKSKGEFTAYIVVDTKGLYVYADIVDITLFPALNTNANDGDCFQFYMDWTPEEYMHPSPEARTEMEAAGTPWDKGTYKSTYGSGLSGMQYLGWLSFDYGGNYVGSAGFSSPDQLGEDFEGIEWTYKTVEGGWICEVFVPWRDSEQKEAIANGEQFHCSLGFQSNDDADVDQTCTPDVEKNTSIRFDQRRELGLQYYADYSMLADLSWTMDAPGQGGEGGEKPGENPDTSDSVIAVVAAIAVAGAGVALFAKKKEN